MTLKNTVMPYVVPETQRKANSRARTQRDAWRRRYAMLSKAIRDTKSDMKSVDFSISYQYQMTIQLDALREAARLMMAARHALGDALRDTSYRYAPAEQVAAVKKIRLWG